MVKSLVSLLRVRHWLKNVLVLVPLFFSGQFLDAWQTHKAVGAFFSFSLAASLVYVINDLMDVDSDRKHPTKRSRPIASGAISPSMAIAIAVALALASVTTCFLRGGGIAALILLAYVLLNLAYSAGAKRVPILDVLMLAAGFVIRVVFGAAACNIAASGWLYLTVLAGSIFLGFGKRRGEMDVNGSRSRGVLDAYPRSFLDKNMYVFLGLTITFYALWARESLARLWTVPIVMTIFMRYSLLVERGGDSDPMGTVMSDPPTLALCAAYCMLMGVILYVPGAAI